MRIARNLLFASVAATVLAASGALTLANASTLHTLVVQLPNGGTAQIQYTGNIPPHVIFGTTPVAADFYSPASSFAALDRISTEMDRDMDAMMREADALALPPPVPMHVFNVELGGVPPGVTQYSVVSTRLGDGHFCMQSEKVISGGPGEAPKVVSHSYGSCSALGQSVVGSEHPVLRGHAHSGTIRINAPQTEQDGMTSLRDAVYRSAH